MKNKLYKEILLLTDNLDEYTKEGFKIKYDTVNNHLIVNYNNSKDYIIKVISYNNNFYWHLSPYKNSYYTTLYSNGIDIVLFSIKENELINK